MAKGHGGGGGSHGAGGVAGRSAGGADGTVSGAGAEFAGLREDKLQSNTDAVVDGDAGAEKRSEALANKITAEQRDAIREYSAGGTRFEAIRNADAGKSADPSAVAQAKQINAAIAKAPKVEQTVYRGIAVNRSTLQSIMKQKQIHIDALASSSRSAMEARRFVSDNVTRSVSRSYGVIFKIKQRSGASIDSMSPNKSEREVILPKGMKLRITKFTRTSVVAWEGRTPTLVVHAEEI